MANKIVEIPEDLWVDFINIVYAAIQHIEQTKENKDIMFCLRQIVGKAFDREEVLVIDKKIVPRTKPKK